MTASGLFQCVLYMVVLIGLAAGPCPAGAALVDKT